MSVKRTEYLPGNGFQVYLCSLVFPLATLVVVIVFDNWVEIIVVEMKGANDS